PSPSFMHRVDQTCSLLSAHLLGPARFGPLRRLGEHVRDSLRVSRYRALNVPSDHCIDVQIGLGGRTSSATRTPGYSHEQYEHPNKQREPSQRVPHPSSSPVCKGLCALHRRVRDRKSTRLNSSHVKSSYAVFC